jgi:NitT/TauT family transport system substrate-binding protein
MTSMKAKMLLLAAAFLALAGQGGAAEPTFSLAWSEYPSWSVFAVAAEKGLINGDAGQLGTLEKKWGVDVELKQLEYPKCVSSYTFKSCDAVCITNLDLLVPSLTRKSVAVLPTSTSAGADALIVVGIKDLDELKSHKVYGLTESVSDYAFTRLLEKNGKNPADYKFERAEPGNAARNMQTKAEGVDAIMVWNPYLLQTLNARKDARVLFDSAKIPEEIIDLVVVGDDVLKKDKGVEFACCLADCFYEFNRMLDDPAQRKDLLAALGKRFANLSADDVAKCLEQTKFYKTPDDALKLFTGKQLPRSMDIVLDNYTRRKILKESPKLGYGGADKAGDAQVRFDPTSVKMVKDRK